MKVLLRSPSREVDIDGPIRVDRLLEELSLPKAGVLVVRNGTLVTSDTVLSGSDVVEIRSVVSGGI